MTFKVGDLVSSTNQMEPSYLVFRHGVVTQVSPYNGHIRVFTREHGTIIAMPKEIQMATVDLIE